MQRWILLFLKGSRVKTWPASLVPFCMSSLLAYYQNSTFEWITFILTGLSILMIQISVNLFNDAIDGKQGLDDLSSRLGPVRLVGSGQAQFSEVQALAFFTSFLSVFLALPLIWKGGVGIALAGVLSLLAAYFYSASSYSLLKLGLSELSVVVFFGFFIVYGTYYLQTLSFSFELFYLALQCGLWSLFILMINHLRDEKEDRKKGRKHLVILYGRENSLLFIVLLQAFIYLLCFYWVNLFPLAGLLSLLSSLFSCFVLALICSQPVKKYNLFLALAGIAYTLFGVSWMLGLALDQGAF